MFSRWNGLLCLLSVLWLFCSEIWFSIIEVIMDMILLYIIYIYLSLFLLTFGPSYKNILHGFPTSLGLQQGGILDACCPNIELHQLGGHGH